MVTYLKTASEQFSFCNDNQAPAPTLRKRSRLKVDEKNKMENGEDDKSRAALRLYHAVENNNVDLLKELLVDGSDVHFRYFDDKSLLHICCEKGRLDCAKLLIDYGANIQAEDEWKMTPLMYCMVRQFNEIAKELLTRDPYSVHCQDRFGKAAIHSAVSSGSLELVHIVLDYGANINQTDWYGVTPLMFLCSGPELENQNEMCKTLIGAGADVHLKDSRSKRTALQFAAVRKNTSLVQELLVAGSDPNTLDTAGRTPLTNLIFQHYRLKNSTHEVDGELMTIVIMLTQAGANLNLNIRENTNPICMAAIFGVEALIRFFLDCGADPNVKFPMGVTSLLMAVKKKQVGCVRVLLSWNCRSDIKGRIYKTPNEQYWVDAMELAVDLGCWEIVYLLYLAGHNISKLPYLRENVTDTKLPESLLGNTEMISWLQHLASSPKPLFHLTTLTVWNCLQKNVTEGLKDLPLPPRIIDLLSPDYVFG